ncbi:MAG: aspartate/glutamate racemase family protein [Alphaproteobacteria bacterium]
MTTDKVGRRLVGMLTPSSNTTLEPVCAGILADLPDVSAHFSRFRVTRIALADDALAQFDHSELLRAAELLGDARCQVIAWNGTSAGWLGFEHDRDLCRRIEAATGALATTTTLASAELFRRWGMSRIGLVTPYTDDVQAAIVGHYGEEGLDCRVERHLGISENFAFSEVPPDRLAAMCRDVAPDVDAVMIYCTNLNGAAVAAEIEAEIGKPVVDSVALTVWHSLDRLGVDMARLRPWGRLFGS